MAGKISLSLSLSRGRTSERGHSKYVSWRVFAIKLGLLASGKMRMVSRRRWCILCSLRRHQFIPKKSMLDRRSALNMVCVCPFLAILLHCLPIAAGRKCFKLSFRAISRSELRKWDFFRSLLGVPQSFTTFLRSATVQKIVSAL